MPVFSSRISLRFLTALLCFVALPLFPHKVLANPAAPVYQRPDQPYALIFGTVWGPDDHPLYGVKVKIRRAQDKRARWELYSDHRGEFAQRISAGKADYVVWADLKNFKSADGKPLHPAQGVAVHVEADERVDVSLHLTR